MTTSSDTLDLGQLSTYLAAHMPDVGAISSATKFAGGQSNPTYRLETAQGPLVLRSRPRGKLLKSAHAIDREFQVMKALGGSDVPVPVMHHFCEDPQVFGSDFFIMEFLEGRIWWDQTLPDQSTAERTAIYHEMNRVLAALHDVDVVAAGLGDYGKPGGYFERQVGTWIRQYRAAETETIADMDALIDWLQANTPVDDGQVSLVHGDYRLDNMIWHPTIHRVIALVDWELSTLGHPLADLAYQCMQWRLPPGKLTRGLAGTDRAALGIPSEEAYVEEYCKRRHLTGVDHWTFALAFSFFRLAGIVQGVRKRALDGNASSTQADAVGKMVFPLSRHAIELIEAAA